MSIGYADVTYPDIECRAPKFAPSRPYGASSTRRRGRALVRRCWVDRRAAADTRRWGSPSRKPIPLDTVPEAD